MVVTGETDVEPEAVGVTVPTLLSMANDVASVVVHDSEDELPDVIEVGSAVSVQVGAAAVTVIVGEPGARVSATIGCPPSEVFITSCVAPIVAADVP